MKSLWLILCLLVWAAPCWADTETLRPNADGDITELTDTDGDADNYDEVDEAVSDGATTVVSCNAAGGVDKRDLYNLPSPSTLTASDRIDSVTVYVNSITSPEPHTPQVAVVLKENGTETSGTLQSLATSFADYSQTWGKRPSDNTNWTYDDIVALQIGVRHKAAATSPGDIIRTTQVYVVVDYTVGGPQIIGPFFSSNLPVKPSLEAKASRLSPAESVPTFPRITRLPRFPFALRPEWVADF